VDLSWARIEKVDAFNLVIVKAGGVRWEGYQDRVASWSPCSARRSHLLSLPWLAVLLTGISAHAQAVGHDSLDVPTQ
jgi:hypothetical protein